MPSVRKSLLQFVFAGAFMKRWNDKLRPMELLEVDKQAHKMIAAWSLYRLTAADMPRQEALDLATRIVEGGLFDYFYRLVITDIKPPIFYQIKENPDHYRQLTDWVLEQLEPRVQPLGAAFWDRLVTWLRADPAVVAQEPSRRILAAAHLYASWWEFNLIKRLSPEDDELQEIDAHFHSGLSALTDLPGVHQLLAGFASPSPPPLARFLNLCGQLRFQIRWSQTPRVPETSVLGHMFIVACYGYCLSLAVEACPSRCVNNFFAGLFHDLPELLTRDIISPVKKSVQHIGDLIAEYERRELQRRVLSPLTQGGLDTLSQGLTFLLGLEVGGEFVPSILQDGRRVPVSEADLYTRFNTDHHDPKDGDLLKVCDTLAAYIEAYTALRNGISSDQLQEGLWRIRSAYHKRTLGPDFHIGALLADFD